MAGRSKRKRNRVKVQRPRGGSVKQRTAWDQPVCVNVQEPPRNPNVDGCVQPVAKRSRGAVMDRLSAWRIQTHAPSINIISILHGRACLRPAEHTDVKMHSGVSTHTACVRVLCAGAPVGD